MLDRLLRFYIPGFSVDDDEAFGLRVADGDAGFAPTEPLLHLDGPPARSFPAVVSLPPVPDGLVRPINQIRVGPAEDMPGFNLDESRLPHETTWFQTMAPGASPAYPDAGQALALLSDLRQSRAAAPAPPPWLSALLRMPLPPSPAGQRSVPQPPPKRSGAYQETLPQETLAPIASTRSLPSRGRAPSRPSELGARQSTFAERRPWNGGAGGRVDGDRPVPAPIAPGLAAGPLDQALGNGSLLRLQLGQPSGRVEADRASRPRDGAEALRRMPAPWAAPGRPAAGPTFVRTDAAPSTAPSWPLSRPATRSSRAGASPGSAPAGERRPPPAGEQSRTTSPTSEGGGQSALPSFVEAFREAATELGQSLADDVTQFGNRFYRDTILKAGSDLRRLAERFVDDAVGTTLSVLNSFPQARSEREFVAAFAAVFTILANAARGLAFERAVLDALNAAKNTKKISVEGVGRSVPDILLKGVTEIKSGLEIDNSLQLTVQAAYARAHRIPFNLVVSSTTRRVSEPVQTLVSETHGTIQRFDLETRVFSKFE
jgi:hypothetical protein